MKTQKAIFKNGDKVRYVGSIVLSTTVNSKEVFIKKHGMEFEIIETNQPQKGIGVVGTDDDGEPIIDHDVDGHNIYIDAIGNRKIIWPKYRDQWEKVKDEPEFKPGSFAMCWYYKIPSEPRRGLDLYYCKIISIGVEYAKCEIYSDNVFQEGQMHVKGIFKDVCIGDLKPFEL